MKFQIECLNAPFSSNTKRYEQAIKFILFDEVSEEIVIAAVFAISSLFSLVLSIFSKTTSDVNNSKPAADFEPALSYDMM